MIRHTCFDLVGNLETSRARQQKFARWQHRKLRRVDWRQVQIVPSWYFITTSPAGRLLAVKLQSGDIHLNLNFCFLSHLCQLWLIRDYSQLYVVEENELPGEKHRLAHRGLYPALSGHSLGTADQNFSIIRS